jgi:gamma-glutamyl:cysteine ligase YbdK (ATP-grasp superfamily)
MDPNTETRLWPYENNIIYETYHRIFDCRGHGWSNLQCVHLNYSFANDEEFSRLHTAIRLVLPILPALAASSPVHDAKSNGFLDSRMRFYRTNSERIPSITGRIIPEAVHSREEYHRKILTPMYHDIAPHDPQGILQDEWLNARGAITRFDRQAIEIRILDIQETPFADIAYAMVIDHIIKNLVQETYCSFEDQNHWKTKPLEHILLSCIKYGENAFIDPPAYLRLFGISSKTPIPGWELWKSVIDQTLSSVAIKQNHLDALRTYQQEGSLATRILKRLHGSHDIQDIKPIYQELCQCLQAGTSFHGP